MSEIVSNRASGFYWVFCLDHEGPTIAEYRNKLRKFFVIGEEEYWEESDFLFIDDNPINYKNK